MNKSLLGFLAGVVIICIGVIGYIGLESMDKADDGAKSVPTPVRAPQTTTRDTSATSAQPARITPPVSTNTPAAASGPTNLTMTRSVGGDGIYTPGGTVDLTITLDGAGADPVRALGISEQLPAGFVFDSMLGDNRPDVGPPAGRGGTVEFAWITVPEFPVSFTYRVRAEDGASGEQVLRGEALYRTNGPELRTGAIASTLRPGEGGTANPAPAAQQTAAATPATDAAEAATPAANPVPEMAIQGATRAADPAARGGDNTPAEEPAPTATEAPEAPAAAPTTASGDAPVELKREVSTETYVPEEPIEVTVTLNYAGDPILALAAIEEVPSGWAYDGFVRGEKPAVEPPKGPRERLTFIWITVPTFPTTFTYRLIPAEGESGPRTINGYTVFRKTGPEVQGPPTVTQLNG